MNKAILITPRIDESWAVALQKEFCESYFSELKNTLLEEKKKYAVFPPGELIFSAFDHTPLTQLKVVIIGQDPYHGLGQANGLCFSVSDTIAHPPSLINIFKEIENDLGYAYPKSGNLENWAKQGVMLLNACLTVRSGDANSHKEIGWGRFTDAVIQKISEEKENVVFLLWGGFAKKKQQLIDTKKHKIFTTGHPSPLSANRGYWFGNKHFSKTNEFLVSIGEKEIDWKV